MNRDPGPVPAFTAVVSVLMIVVGFISAFGFFADPGKLMPDLDVGNSATASLAFMMGARSFSMAVALLLVLVLRSRLGLVAVLTMRVLTEMLDMTANIQSGNSRSGAVMIVVLMIGLEIGSIFLLVRKLREAK